MSVEEYNNGIRPLAIKRTLK